MEQAHGGEVLPAEWRVRVDLAALYRLAALERYDDLLLTHISARVPDNTDHFLINPFGLRFGEVRASDLVKVDAEGAIISETPFGINHAGFVIHSAIHMARQDARFVIHLHTDDGVAVSSHREGLLPLNQRAVQVINRLAYHEYEGIADELDERERIVADLGDKTMLILKHHGTLALGPTPGAAWLAIHALEKACTVQVRALSAGRDGVTMAPEAAQARLARPIDPKGREQTANLAWASLLRRVDAESPGYDA